MLRAHYRGMMTQQLSFSILTAPLAATDRRVLSQAWYSALHVVKEKQLHTESASSAAKPAFCRSGAIRMPGDREVRSAGPRIASQRPAHAGRERAGEQDRRAPRSSLARKIERCFLDPVRRTQRATFTVEGSNARVHIALQSTAHGVRLLAVCPPSVRERVMRALDEARYALATRGIALDADLRSASA